MIDITQVYFKCQKNKEPSDVPNTALNYVDYENKSTDKVVMTQKPCVIDTSHVTI